MKKKIGVIAAHPDDEVLGCGASIAEHIKKGDEVYVLILAEGITSRDNIRSRKMNDEKLSDLALSAKKAHRILGTTYLELLDFPDNRLDSIDRLDIIKKVESFISKFSVSVIYTHYQNDLNIDHRIVHDATMVACRPKPGSIVKEILSFEVPSSTEWGFSPDGKGFSPNFFNVFDLSSIEKKRKALEAYNSEMCDWPHSRSLEAVMTLAKWRGASIGSPDGAEAFEVVRIINNMRV